MRNFGRPSSFFQLREGIADLNGKCFPELIAAVKVCNLSFHDLCF
jgi:hypothetical protein